MEYSKLFNIKIYHDFNSSGLNEDFVIKPTKECNKKLKEYGLLVRKNSCGLTILFPKIKNEILKEIEEKIKFEFLLVSENEYLLNFSNLPLEENKQQIYYLSNIDADKVYRNNLHNLNTNISENDRISIKPLLFTYTVESVNTSVNVEIKNYFKEIVKSDKVYPIDNKYNYHINLSSLNSGFYELIVDGTSKLKFYASDEIIGSSFLGVIEITREDMSEKEYKITFKRRNSIWRYYVEAKYRNEIKKDDLKLYFPKSVFDDLSITVPNSFNVVNGKVEIEADSESTNSDSTNVILFKLFDSLPLYEEAYKGIDLKIDKNASSFEIKNLANPSVKNISRSLVNGKPTGNKYYSDIYIYI